MLRRVLVEGWQHECCGERFAVGDEVAWTAVPMKPGETAEALGIDLYEDHHDVEEGAAPVAGVVRHIHVLSQEYRLERRTWMPVPGRFRLREVVASPDGFGGEMDGEGPVWSESGMVVDLEV